jgi:uncharacterized protein with GYD domain
MDCHAPLAGRHATRQLIERSAREPCHLCYGKLALLLHAQTTFHFREPVEDHMPTFILTLNWTEQGIRAVKDAPKRSQAAKELAKKLGVEIKQAYLTSGEHDLLLVVESASGDNVAKFALATGALGNVRTSTARAWSEPEWHKLISELP